MPKATTKVTKASRPKKQSLDSAALRRPLTRHAAKCGEHQFYRSLDSFSNFPKLPAELRLKIWRESLPKPRIVSRDPDFIRGPVTKWAQPSLNNQMVKHGFLRRMIPASEKKNPVLQWERNPLFVPAIAHSCRESRSVFLEHYQRFSTKIDGRIDNYYGVVYMNFDYDVLDLGSSMHSFTGLIKWAEGEDFLRKRCAKVKKLSIESNEFSQLVGVNHLMETFDFFPSLEKVYFYYESEYEPDDDVLRGLESLFQRLVADWRGPRKQKIHTKSSFVSYRQLLDEYKEVGDLGPVTKDTPVFIITTMEGIREDLGMSELAEAVHIF